MARPVRCSIVDMPDGRFGVVAVLASGNVFRRAGLLTLAEAEECAEILHAVMAACGAPVTRCPAAMQGAGSRQQGHPVRRR